MDVRLATDHDQVVWDRYVLKHPDGVAYHQYAWKKAIADAYHFDACYLVAEQNERVCGVLPLIEFKRPLLGRSFVSLPYCDLGGHLTDTPDVGKTLLVKAKALAAEKNVESIELRQTVKGVGSDAQADRWQKVRMVLELPDSSEILFKSMKAKLRSQVRKPMRDGLTVKLGGLELVTEFYQIFTENMRDIGSPVHSRKWVESVVRHFDERARVGVVYTPEGEPAAGGIILLHGKTVSIPWASSLQKFNKMNPNMLLYWTFLAFAADHGFNRFDFGRSTPGEGTFHFKEQWGAQPEDLAWEKYAPDGKLKQSLRSNPVIRQRVEKIWSRMPLGFCNVLGPLLRRHISL